jgi:hypothetical protein
MICQRCLKNINDGVHTCTPSALVRALEQDIESLRREISDVKEVQFPRKFEAVSENWRKQLEASKAYEQKLLEALNSLNMGWDFSLKAQEIIDSALAIPNDDTCLKQALADERERAAKVVDSCCFVCAAAIRALP